MTKDFTALAEELIRGRENWILMHPEVKVLIAAALSASYESGIREACAELGETQMTDEVLRALRKGEK